MKGSTCVLNIGSGLVFLIGQLSPLPGYVRYVHGDLDALKRGQPRFLPIEMFTIESASTESSGPYFAIHRTPAAMIGSLKDRVASYVVITAGQRISLDLRQAQRMNREVGSNDIRLKYCMVSRRKGEYLVTFPTRRDLPSGHYAYEGTFLWQPEQRSLKFLGAGAPYGEIGESGRPVLIRQDYLDGQSGRIGLSVALEDRVVDLKVPDAIEGHKSTILWAVLSSDRAGLVVDAGSPRWLFTIDELGNQRREK